jgi:hypothetical protein
VSEVVSVPQHSDKVRERDKSAKRLLSILRHVKVETGEVPLYVTTEGWLIIHPAVSRKLSEPGNEGPLEFLGFMRRTGRTAIRI